MSLKILNYLFTGPFEVNQFKYRKNKKPTIFLFIEKSGTNYAPEFNAVHVLKTANNDIDLHNYYLENLKSKFSNESDISIFFKEFSLDDELKRISTFEEIKLALNKFKKVSMQY